jgi:hypothetical protein
MNIGILVRDESMASTASTRFGNMGIVKAGGSCDLSTVPMKLVQVRSIVY